MKNDKCLLCIIVAVFTVTHVKVEGGKEGGGSHHEFTNNNFVLHESQNKFYVFMLLKNRVRTKCLKRYVSPIL